MAVSAAAIAEFPVQCVYFATLFMGDQRALEGTGQGRQPTTHFIELTRL